ncbi:MAG: Lrp/AsnC ligand binding domain-containing protein [Kiritimatiellae bacterium]|nr:Lrp/AsnC ligand binding domain-containing protein [Kiritimatiellia bacterium]
MTNEVRAVIELKITPQRECGFGKIAQKVSAFEQVEACFLMSGGYDLLVFVKGESLQDVAAFVAQDLSTIDGVISTATHFMLKTYKSKGLADGVSCDGRLAVTP